MSATGTTVREPFTLPLQSSSVESEIMVGAVVFRWTYNRHVPLLYVTRMNNNQLAIIHIMGIVKDHDSGGAIATATRWKEAVVKECL